MNVVSIFLQHKALVIVTLTAGVIGGGSLVMYNQTMGPAAGPARTPGAQVSPLKGGLATSLAGGQTPSPSPSSKPGASSTPTPSPSPGAKAGSNSGAKAGSSGTASTGASGGGGTTAGSGGSTPNTPPSAPTNLHTTSVSSSQVGLAFSAGTDSNGIARHELLRDGAVISTSTSQNSTVTMADGSVVAGHSYAYTVRAVDTLGATSGLSNSITVPVPVADTTPPSAPTNFHMVSNNPESVWLGWNASSDNVTSAGNLWYILSSSSGGGYYLWTRDNPHESITLDSGQSYDMYIRAVDEAGNESAAVGPLTFTAQ